MSTVEYYALTENIYKVNSVERHHRMGVDKEVKPGISFNVLKYRKQRNRKSQS